MARETDTIDRVVAEWARARPDLDPSPLELVGRVIVLARHLERGVGEALEPHGLSLGQFDILATLRRHEPRGGLNPTQLCENVALTSGGMTSRLDRLEEAGWIARKPDPTDRRGVVVILTAKGRKLIDAATKTRLDEAADSLPALNATDRAKLADMLRTWLAAYS